MNVCPTCSKQFNSVYAFDKHRAGSYGKLSDDGRTYLPSIRYCLTEEQMQKKGMSLNAAGLWVGEAMPDAYLSKLQGEA